MPFLGTTPTQGFVGANPKQSFTANGSTTVFTLTNPVANANDLEVFVGNVRQEPTAAYSATGTTLTMSEAPDTGLNFYVINKSQAQVTTTPVDGSVSTAKIVNDAVTDAKLATGVSASKLTTGTLPSTQTPAGTTLQTVHSSPTTTFGGTSSSVVKILEVSLTTKAANSHFLISTIVPIGTMSSDANNDSHDISLAIGYKLASAADSAYVSRGGRSTFGRQSFTGTAIGAGGAFYQSDVPHIPNRADTHSGQYDVMEHGTTKLDTSNSLAAGTAIKYAVYSHSQNDYFINRARESNANGGSMFLTVTEIKT